MDDGLLRSAGVLINDYLYGSVMKFSFPNLVHVADDFSSTVCLEAWDRLKVTCCQPFRKDVQHGISLIRIIASEKSPNQVR